MRPAMKRFYKFATVQDAQAGFEIHLDGKALRAPSGRTLISPSRSLAEAVAEEWSGQGQDIIPDTMPLMQMLTTALDRVAVERAAIMNPLIAYLDTDLVCYRAAEPDAASRQAASWDVWLDWFADTYKTRLSTTHDLHALKQPEKAHIAVRAVLEGMDIYRFTAAQLVTGLTGSIVLGLAFTHGAITPAQVYGSANVDEIYKSEIYNEDFYGVAPNQQKRNEAMQRDLAAAERFLNLLDR